MEFLIFLFLIGLGFFAGSAIEKNHLRHLAEREAELAGLCLSSLKTVPANWTVTQCQLVTGTAVISTDYFKTFAASLRNLFGGRMRSMETLVDRARRQAMVRMMEEARSAGANAIWNIRLETSTIGNAKGQPGAIEVIVSGTALRAE